MHMGDATHWPILIPNTLNQRIGYKIQSNVNYSRWDEPFKK